MPEHLGGADNGGSRALHGPAQVVSPATAGAAVPCGEPTSLPPSMPHCLVFVSERVRHCLLLAGVATQRDLASWFLDEGEVAAYVEHKGWDEADRSSLVQAWSEATRTADLSLPNVPTPGYNAEVQPPLASSIVSRSVGSAVATDALVPTSPPPQLDEAPIRAMALKFFLFLGESGELWDASDPVGQFDMLARSALRLETTGIRDKFGAWDAWCT